MPKGKYHISFNMYTRDGIRATEFMESLPARKKADILAMVICEYLDSRSKPEKNHGDYFSLVPDANKIKNPTALNILDTVYSELHGYEEETAISEYSPEGCENFENMEENAEDNTLKYLEDNNTFAMGASLFD